MDFEKHNVVSLSSDQSFLSFQNLRNVWLETIKLPEVLVSLQNIIFVFQNFLTIFQCMYIVHVHKIIMKWAVSKINILYFNAFS